MYPKIYLAMDNCVFYKRWTEPDEWAERIRNLGIRFIEASADTELDPLYMGQAYFYDWVEKVKNAEEKYDVKVSSLFSGHGTYTTLGLTHPDVRVRRNMVENWFFPMIRAAGELKCNMGFFAHAIKHELLQSCDTYRQYVEILSDELSELNQYAAMTDCGTLGIEQMYTPHQYPWRQKDIRELLQIVTQKSGRNFYFTEDVGHHQSKFLRPAVEQLHSCSRLGDLWLGTDRAYELADTFGKAALREIEEEMEHNPQLFAEEQDGDCYTTIRQLGCYSPIIHLQQTNGMQSTHLPFTSKENEKGIIDAGKLLRALKESYELPQEPGYPEKSPEIYLTLELFSGTTSIMHDVLDNYAESISYWRKFIPQDGMLLTDLLNKIDFEKS